MQFLTNTVEMPSVHLGLYERHHKMKWIKTARSGLHSHICNWDMAPSTGIAGIGGEVLLGSENLMAKMLVHRKRECWAGSVGALTG